MIASGSQKQNVKLDTSEKELHDSDNKEFASKKSVLSLHQAVPYSSLISRPRIFSLPEHLLINILAYWLELTDLARFDSAICNDQDRGLFLSFLRQVVRNDFVILKSGVERWIYQRKIGLEIIGFFDLHTEFFPFKWSLMKKVMVGSMNDLLHVLRNCSNLSEFGAASYHVLSNEDMNNLGEFLLDSKNCLFNRSILSVALGRNFQHSTVIEAISNFSHLEEFTLCSDEISDKDLSPLFLRCKKLKILAIKGALDIRQFNLALTNYLSACDGNILPSLVDLTLPTLSLCNNETLLAVGTLFPNLEVFKFSLSSEPADDGIICIAENCQNLRVISFISGESSLRDFSMRTLFKKCPKLTHLSILNAPLLTDCTLLEISSSCLNLISLDLGGLSFTQSGFSTFASTFCCRFLQALTLIFVSIDDTSFVSMISRCCRLKMLYIAECAYISDISVSNISLNCRHLDRLVLSTLPGITNVQQILDLIRNNPGLARTKDIRLRQLGHDGTLDADSPAFDEIFMR